MNRFNQLLSDSPAVSRRLRGRSLGCRPKKCCKHMQAEDRFKSRETRKRIEELHQLVELRFDHTQIAVGHSVRRIFHDELKVSLSKPHRKALKPPNVA